MKKNKSSRTKLCQKRAIIFHIVSLCCWLGVAIFAVIASFSKIAGSERAGVDILSETVKTKLVSVSITLLIGLIVAMIIKEKARLTVYMLSLIALTIIYKEVAMYIVLGIWALDEYVFSYLYKKYKSLVSINKEIDLREKE